MTPAAFLQADEARDSFATARQEGALRLARSPRRSMSAFAASYAPAPLFHAWRP